MVAECNDKQNVSNFLSAEQQLWLAIQVTTPSFFHDDQLTPHSCGCQPTVPAPAPITAIQESQEDLPSPGKDNSACVTPATESISQSAPIGITAVTVDAPDSAADLYKSRRASLIKRKPVPAYDDNWNAISSPVSSSIAASSIPEVAAV